MMDKYWYWMNWIATIDNENADALSRFKWDIINAIPYELVNKDREALNLAREGIQIYNESRKRMVRNKEQKKICQCKNKERCKEQPLYKKWQS